jgi:hypothetical protein
VPIVINEFEIVVDRPEVPPPGVAPPLPAPEPPAPAPDDIVRVLRRHRERLERVRAR